MKVFLLVSVLLLLSACGSGNIAAVVPGSPRALQCWPVNYGLKVCEVIANGQVTYQYEYSYGYSY